MNSACSPLKTIETWRKAARGLALVLLAATGQAHAQSDGASPTGLLRDISEVFAKDRVNVTGVHTQSVKAAGGPTAYMTFTVELGDATRLAAVLRAVAQVPGIRHARRR